MESSTIIALWGADAGRLQSAEFHDALRKVGVSRLQVNISDADVDGAMRITHYDRPIDAVVSTWGAENVLDAVSDAADDVAAWTVTRREPLNPTLPSQSRVDALSNIAFLRKPDDLAYDEWRRLWLDEHTQVAIDTQSTFGYYQNIVSKPLTDNAIGVTAIVEELFPMAAIGDMHAFYGSGGDDQVLQERLTAMLTSVSRMGADRNLDLVPTSRYDYPL